MGTSIEGKAGALLLLAALAVPGCSATSGVDTSGGSSPSTAAPDSSSASPSATPPASPSPRVLREAHAILSQYRAFFASLTPLSKATYKVRLEAISKLAVEPELTRVLGGIAASQAVGEVGYGQTVVRPQIQTVDGSTARLTDCQDGSRTGRMKQATRKKITVGKPDQLAKVTMRRAPDGVWRVATIEYAPDGSCQASA